MTKAKPPKLCDNCKEKQAKNGKSLYCLECGIEINRRNRAITNRAKNIKSKKQLRERLDSNFHFLNLSGEQLFPLEFNKRSKLNTRAYAIHFKKNWVQVLKRYGKYESFVEAVENKYIEWNRETGRQSYIAFSKDVGVLVKYLKECGDLTQAINSRVLRYEDWEFDQEFYRVVSFYGRIPSRQEFESESRFPVVKFKNRFSLKGNFYEQILIKYNIERKEIDKALLETSKEKGRMFSDMRAGISVYTDKDLEIEFKRVFDYHIEKFGCPPTHRFFKKNAKIGISTYSIRTGMTFIEIAEGYGYEMEVSASKFEKSVLTNFKNILKEDFEAQAKFDWLISDSQRHLRCDGFFSNKNLIVEADGEQHFRVIDLFGEESFKRTQANDAIKNKLIPEHGLTLIRIAYNDPYWDEDFLRVRLIESNIIPPNYTMIEDSALALSL